MTHFDLLEEDWGEAPELAALASADSTPPSRATATRVFEIAALRPDGSMFIGQLQAPAIALFDSAFSAFGRGTAIATPEGDVAVEDLQPGDRISTFDGEERTLVWIGSSNFIPADTGQRVPHIRIMPGAFGKNSPAAPLTVGPGARLLHTPEHLRGEDGDLRCLTPLDRFVDGDAVIQVAPPTPVRLFHLCLDRHALLCVHGLPMESFHPGTTGLSGVEDGLSRTFLSMFPMASAAQDFGPLSFPRLAPVDLAARYAARLTA